MIKAKEARNMADGVNNLLKPYLEQIDGRIIARSFLGYYDCKAYLKIDINTLLCKHLLKYLEDLGYNVEIYQDKDYNSVININWKND
jgi:hypothetical protein